MTIVEKHPNLTRSPKGSLSRIPFLPNLLTNMIVNQRIAPKRLNNPKTPSDYGMTYTAVDIHTPDGIRLSAWEIMNPGSGKVAIINHPLMCTRYGTETGLDGVPVEFLPMVKHLFDAGYSVLMYDQRGQGESDGGIGKNAIGREAPVGAGVTEWQDLVGALEYVAQHHALANNRIALITQCMGANAAITAWNKAPDAFDLSKVKCHVAIQPTLSYNMTYRFIRSKLKIDLVDEVEDAQIAKVGFGFSNVLEHIDQVRVPMMFSQVKEDQYTYDTGTGINDVKIIYDACPTEKQLVWIGKNEAKPFGTGKRFEGYTYFNQHPKELLAFLEKHVGN
ncbi:MAG TPA: alpha/beta hydrolase [Anaerolineales bacterium]|nr:alpha/beta hydrolase [Anaerolineales bacterium]